LRTEWYGPRVSRVLPPASEKPRYVEAMFGRIAPRYDLMNTLMTFGLDRHWRCEVAKTLARNAQRATRSVLDVGTGTGRLAQSVQHAAPSAYVTGVDFSQPMLGISRSRLPVAAADALTLPFTDGQFDAVISGFVVRNLADIGAGLREQIRVLRPGGLLVILETTPGPVMPLRPLYRLYFHDLVPWLGGVIAGDPTAYTYLPESTRAFIEPARIADQLGELGLRDVSTRRLSFGAVAITSGSKPA
jgi:demethylmenaquinone methyltransferase/2-methoxy-6-polyprenyl-1,4-benzoquinol methylase